MMMQVQCLCLDNHSYLVITTADICKQATVQSIPMCMLLSLGPALMVTDPLSIDAGTAPLRWQ